MWFFRAHPSRIQILWNESSAHVRRSYAEAYWALAYCYDSLYLETKEQKIVFFLLIYIFICVVVSYDIVCYRVVLYSKTLKFSCYFLLFVSWCHKNLFMNLLRGDSQCNFETNCCYSWMHYMQIFGNNNFCCLSHAYFHFCLFVILCLFPIIPTLIFM